MIDVKKIAEQAGIDLRSSDGYCREDYYAATSVELEAFAALVLEAAAVECEKVSLENYGCTEGTIPSACATRIRSMKPGKQT